MAHDIDPIVTPQEVRENWCFGLPLTKEDGTAMPDEYIQVYIDNAIQEVQRRLSIYLRPTKVRCNAQLRGLVEGADYDLEEPPYDYDFRQYRQWGYLQLREYPIISVDKISLKLPNYQTVVDFPMDWVKVFPKAGQLQIVPYAGSPTVMTIAGASGSAFPLLSGQFSRNFPHAFWIDYTAGFKVCPPDIRAVVAKLSAIDILGIAGDAILAGVASMSTGIDGLSQSVSTTASATNATYGARILQLRGEVKDFFGEGSSTGERGGGSGGARSYYKGFTMTVV